MAWVMIFPRSLQSLLNLTRSPLRHISRLDGMARDGMLSLSRTLGQCSPVQGPELANFMGQVNKAQARILALEQLA